MRRVAGTIAAAAAGAIAGATIMLALPLPGVPSEPAPRTTSPPPRVVGDAPIRTLLAWSPSGLPPGYATDVRELPSVHWAVEVYSGFAWLTGWRGATGSQRTPQPGLAVPVEIAAVDVAEYRSFLPPADRSALAGLAGRGAILGRTGAELRRVGPGASLTFGGVTLRVRGILDDELIGAHEVLVSRATGARLGVVRPRYLLVAPRASVPRRRVEAGLRGVLPAGVRLRVRAPGETPVFRHGDAVLPSVALKETFGEFAAEPIEGGFLRIERQWVARNIRTARVPTLGTVTCHRRIIPMLRGALQELANRGLAGLINPSQYGGCYSPRFLNRSPAAGLSHHAWGVAVDINVAQNPYGAEPRMDRRVVEVFERWGFTWGGRWLVPDAMHFEFMRFPAKV
jgi:D-alanyl-D-alanine carboxypeptidase